MAEDLLRLDRVGVRLGGREILRDVSFAVAPGEFTGLIGPNGAGKTTLLKVTLGLQQATTGSVLIDGGAPARRMRASIGYVPQKLNIESGHAAPGPGGRGLWLGIDGHKFGFRLPSGDRGERSSAALAAVGRRAGSPTRGSASCPAASSSGS